MTTRLPRFYWQGVRGYTHQLEDRRSWFAYYDAPSIMLRGGLVCSFGDSDKADSETDNTHSSHHCARTEGLAARTNQIPQRTMCIPAAKLLGRSYL